MRDSPLAYDQVGSLLAVSDSSGTVVKSIQYDSFGNILSCNNGDVYVFKLYKL
jgi:hypothetical protein